MKKIDRFYYIKDVSEISKIAENVVEASEVFKHDNDNLRGGTEAVLRTLFGHQFETIGIIDLHQAHNTMMPKKGKIDFTLKGKTPNHYSFKQFILLKQCYSVKDAQKCISLAYYVLNNVDTDNTYIPEKDREIEMKAEEFVPEEG